MKKKIIIGIMVIALVGSVLWLGNKNKERNNEVSYTVSVEPVSLTSTVSTVTNANGKVKIKGNKVKNVVLGYNAIIKELNVDHGQSVKKGDTLFKVQKYSNNEYKQKLEALEASIADYKDKLEVNNIVGNSDYAAQEKLIKEQVKNIKTKQDNLNTQLDTLKEKKENEEITEEAYKEQKQNIESTILDLKVKIQELEYSKKQITQNKKEHANVEKQLNSGIADVKNQIEELKAGQAISIKAPKSGTVSWSRELYVGLSLQQNQSVLKITNAEEVKSYYVEVDLAESEYGQISEDSKATLICGSGMKSREYKGKISDEKPTIHYTNDIAYYAVKILFDEESVDLIADMPVQVKIDSKLNISESENQETTYYILPIYSVVSRNDKNAVFLYQKNEKKNVYNAKLVYVNIVTSNSDTVIVQSNELNEDSVVITDGNYDLYGGELVILDQGQQSGYMNLNLFNS